MALHPDDAYLYAVESYPRRSPRLRDARHRYSDTQLQPYNPPGPLIVNSNHSSRSPSRSRDVEQAYERGRSGERRELDLLRADREMWQDIALSRSRSRRSRSRRSRSRSRSWSRSRSRRSSRQPSERRLNEEDIIAKHERQQREQKDRVERMKKDEERTEQEMKNKFEREDRKKKEDIEKIKKDALREEKEKERAKKEERESIEKELLRKQKDGEEKKKAKDKEDDTKMKEGMKKRLRDRGFSERRVTEIVDKEATPSADKLARDVAELDVAHKRQKRGWKKKKGGPFLEFSIGSG